MNFSVTRSLLIPRCYQKLSKPVKLLSQICPKLVLVTSRDVHSSHPRSAPNTKGVIERSKVAGMNLQRLNTGSPALDAKRPLVVMFAWMLAQQKQVDRFADFYVQQGYDILTVYTFPAQLLNPVSGTQITADNVIKFLSQDRKHSPIIVHGFSIGAYLFGECLLKLKGNDKGSDIVGRVRGQVFDSAADYYTLPQGLPRAMFPNNQSLQKVMEQFLKIYMRLMFDKATKHYIRSSDQFHENYIKAPSHFFFSKDDPVGTAEANLRVIKTWENNGIEVSARCWDSSPHIKHFRNYPDDYLGDLSKFLAKIDMLKIPFDPSFLSEKQLAVARRNKV